MKYLNRLLLLLLCLIAGVSHGQQNMTLQQCLDYAIQNNKTIKNARLDSEKSDQQVIEARSTGLPQVDGTVQLIGNLAIQNGFAREDALFPGGDPNVVVPLEFGLPYQSDANITVSQLLFSNSFFIGLQAAKTYTELSSKNIKFSEEEVQVNVTKAYYGFLVSEERNKLLSANKEQIDQLLTDSKIMVETGVMEQIEVSRLTVTRNNLLTQIERAESAKNISEQLLKFQMGMPLTEKIILDEGLETVLQEKNIEDIPALVKENRLDYQVLQTQLELSTLNVKNVKSNRLPTAAAFGTLGANNGALGAGDLFQFGNWIGYSFIGVQIDVPIFSSWRYQSKVKQSEIEKQQLQNQIEIAKDSYSFEYDQALENYNTIKLSLDRLKDNMDLAQAVYDNAQIKYKNGVGTGYEIVVAETALKESQTNYLSAIYDLLIAKVDLDKSSGNLK